MLETISHEHGSSEHSRVDLRTTLADLEAIDMQWGDLLAYAENARTNWAAFTAVYVPLNKHAVYSSWLGAPGSSKVMPAEQYAGL